uniref:Uncharacterized protein n=1 Tax=Panagrolaimus sp. ES5 TaxID=591445 RepID=A0AC34F4B0_9BILA
MCPPTKIAAVSKLSDFDNSRTRKDLNSWKKSNKSLSSRFLNHDCGILGGKYEVKKEGKYVNNSTLSLHIASYEATNDPLNEENECLEKKNEKSDFDKTCTNANVDGSPSLNQNIFEFPRQQENKKVSTPEISQFKASQKLLNPNTDLQQQQPQPAAASASSAIDVTQPIKIQKNESELSKPAEIQEKEEELKTGSDLDETLSALNILQISLLILVTILHSIGILFIAFFFSIYQIFLSIFHAIKFCMEHPWQTRYGYEALRYGYAKEWWTFKGLYRSLTEPPPPPVFAQRTLSGELKMDPEEAKKLEALRMAKMFHQKRLNGEYTIAGFQPPTPQILELLKKKN